MNWRRRRLSIEEHSMMTVLLLTISNIFMTFAWYGHLKYKQVPLITAILVSWLIAFVEYCFQVPANRIGHLNFESAQLKVMQEVITLVVFGVFSVTYLKEPLRWNYVVGFALMVAAVVFFVFAIPPRNPPAETPPAAVNDTSAV
jgi:uncharacterized protein (DUF486 family)